MILGSHVSMSGKDMFLGSVKEALSYEADTFMLYTGAPQNTKRKPVSELNIEAGSEYGKKHGLTDFIVHAPYIINLGNTLKEETYELAVSFLREEINRTAAMGSKLLVLHPGSHVNAGAKAGLDSVIKGLNAVLTKDTPVTLALETMAGKGSELGRSFEELADIFDGVLYSDKLAVCFDTCHVHDAGYNIVSDFDGVMTNFDRILGTKQIAVIHLNDSMNLCGAQKDRHENVGFGKIGFDALYKIASCEQFASVPKILETPHVVLNPEASDVEQKVSVAPYKEEIAMLRGGHFMPDFYELVRKNANNRRKL